MAQFGTVAASAGFIVGLRTGHIVARRITVSIKALEIAEEKQAVAQFGSSDSGAALGDIFKAAIKKRDADDEPEAE